MEPWEQLTAKLVDTGLSDEVALEWVQEVREAARADERDKFMEEARSDIAAAVLINEAKADEREKIAQAIEAQYPSRGMDPGYLDGLADAARIARDGGSRTVRDT